MARASEEGGMRKTFVGWRNGFRLASCEGLGERYQSSEAILSFSNYQHLVVEP